MKPADIYHAIQTGGFIPHADLGPAFQHFTHLATMLAASGPTFTHASREADRIAGVLQLHLAARKYDAAQEDRHSDSYREGYRTGIVWDQKKDNYRPGGPWVLTLSMHGRDKPEYQARCEASELHARRWLMGFDEGLAAQLAGHKATPDMIACDLVEGSEHRHGLACLIDRMCSVA